MNKTKIKIVKLGKQKHDILFEKLKKYNSQLFCVDIYEKSRPQCDYEWGYSFNLLCNLLVNDFDDKKYDICIGFVDTIIENNYFAKRLKGDNIFVISFYQVDDLLKSENIDVFNFMISTIYRYLTRYKLHGEYLTHDETRGCIFDMCGDKSDIIFSCDKPIICEECMVKMRSKGIETDYINLLQKELKRIHKSNYHRITSFVKKRPYLSMVIGVISSLIINLAACAIYDLLKIYLSRGILLPPN